MTTNEPLEHNLDQAILNKACFCGREPAAGKKFKACSNYMHARFCGCECQVAGRPLHKIGKHHGARSLNPGQQNA